MCWIFIRKFQNFAVKNQNMFSLYRSFKTTFLLQCYFCEREGESLEKLLVDNVRNKSQWILKSILIIVSKKHLLLKSLLSESLYCVRWNVTLTGVAYLVIDTIY